MRISNYQSVRLLSGKWFYEAMLFICINKKTKKQKKQKNKNKNKNVPWEVSVIIYNIAFIYNIQYTEQWEYKVWLIVFNTTFNHISVISGQSVLLVEETRVPGENHRPVASNWQTLSYNVISSTPRHERGSDLQL